MLHVGCAPQVESGQGYNLNDSMFERLQRQGLPLSTLLTQRRMQPAISDLIRGPIYPALQVPIQRSCLFRVSTSCATRYK